MNRWACLVAGLVAALAVAGVLGACDPGIVRPDVSNPTARPASSPSGSPVAVGLDWGTAPDVERPSVIEPAPMPSTYYHPGHFMGQAYMVDVATAPEGWLAVGYEWPDWHAVSWRSPDGLSWRLVDPHESAGTFMTSVAAGPDAIVAVGRDGVRAAAWRSTDGSAWTRVRSPAFIAGEPLRMTTVAAAAGGYVAGGSAGPEIGRHDARFWYSPDGRSWTAAAVDDASDAGVTSIVATGVGFVAVGARGTEREPAGSIAWTSTDGRSWQRAPDSPALRAGQMAALTSSGQGLVAVGTDADQRATVVWRSSEGRAWDRVESPTFTYHGGKIRMTDVTAGGPGFVAVGNAVPGIQYGSARVWFSGDGRSWSLAPDTAAFGQGEMLAVAARPDRVAAVGTFGAPDNYVPTVWVSPPAPRSPDSP